MVGYLFIYFKALKGFGTNFITNYPFIILEPSITFLFRDETLFKVFIKQKQGQHDSSSSRLFFYLAVSFRCLSASAALSV